MMRIAITTHNRKPSYIQTTIQALFRSDELRDADIRIICHERDASFLKEIQYMSRLSVRVLSAEEEAHKLSLGRRVRVRHIGRLALEDAPDDVIWLQDDCCFAPSWYAKFKLMLKQIPDTSHHLISLYSPHESKVNGIVHWPVKTYWSTVAMYFGKTAKEETIKALQTTKIPDAASSTTPGSDVTIQKMLEKSKHLQLFAVYPSLVQHTGHESSIGSRKGSFAPTFGRDEDDF